MNALKGLLGNLYDPDRFKAWGGRPPGSRYSGSIGDSAFQATTFDTDLMARDRALKEAEDIARIQSMNPDYEAIGKMFGQIPQRGGGGANIGGRARIGSDFGMNPQAIDRQRNPNQFQPPERPRIVNNLTQLMRPYQG